MKKKENSYPLKTFCCCFNVSDFNCAAVDNVPTVAFMVWCAELHTNKVTTVKLPKRIAGIIIFHRVQMRVLLELGYYWRAGIIIWK